MRVDARLDDERAETSQPQDNELMERYANLPMDLADASLVVAATELGDGRILSTCSARFRQSIAGRTRSRFTTCCTPIRAEPARVSRPA